MTEPPAGEAPPGGQLWQRSRFGDLRGTMA